MSPPKNQTYHAPTTPVKSGEAGIQNPESRIQNRFSELCMDLFNIPDSEFWIPAFSFIPCLDFNQLMRKH
jgi:hypothetical protein